MRAVRQQKNVFPAGCVPCVSLCACVATLFYRKCYNSILAIDHTAQNDPQPAVYIPYTRYTNVQCICLAAAIARGRKCMKHTPQSKPDTKPNNFDGNLYGIVDRDRSSLPLHTHTHTHRHIYIFSTAHSMYQYLRWILLSTYLSIDGPHRSYTRL